MIKDRYVCAQLVQFIDRNHFNYLVRKYDGDKYVLPKQQDFTPQQAQTFTQALKNALSRFNLGDGSHSQNREWEVGSDGYGKITTVVHLRCNREANPTFLGVSFARLQRLR